MRVEVRPGLEYITPSNTNAWIPETWHRVRSYLADVWETNPRLVSICMVSRIWRALAPAGMLWIWMLTLDGAVDLLTGRRADSRYVWSLIAVECALTVLSDVIARWGTVATSALSDAFGNRLSIRIMNHAQTFEFAEFEDAGFLDTLERARRDSNRRLGLMIVLLEIAQALISVAAFTLLFAALSGWFVVVNVAVAVPVCISELRFAAISHLMFQRRSKDRRFLDYLRFLCASGQSVKEVKMFGLASYLTRRYTATAERMAEEDRTLATRRAVVGGALNIVALLAYYASYAFVFVMFLERSISIGVLMFMVRALSRTRTSVEQLTAHVSGLADEVSSVSDLYGYLERSPRLSAAPSTTRIAGSIRDGFELQDVGFRYPDAPRWALRHVNLRLSIGETVALVGPNGAGKTTLLNLLTRMYEPTEGRILLDGVDLKDYAPDDLRQHISAMFQDFMKYELTVRENIGFGSLTSLNDETRLAAAATTSGSSAVIGRLPQGYEQILGRRFHDGVNLSGGEWQRLALARAFVRDADILILDEPTAALDPLAESELFESLAAICARRLVLLVSHRFSTVRAADRIVVLGGGTLHEEGTHQQLMARRGRYAMLFEMQANGFRRRPGPQNDVSETAIP